MSDVWMKRLIFQAYCFVIGVVVGKIRPLTDSQVPFLYGLFAFLLIGSVFAFVRSKRTRFPALVAVALFGVSCFFLGWGRYSASFAADEPDHISKFASHSMKDRASVEGVIITDPEVFSDRVTFTLNPLRVLRAGANREYEEAGDGHVEVTIRREAKELYREFGRSAVYGWRIRVNAPLMIPPGPQNPHGFSYRDFLADQDIYAVQMLASEWGSPPPIETLDRGEGFFLTEFALALKEKILGVFVKTIPYPQSTFLAGVTLGIRSVLPNVRCIVPGHDWTIMDECRVAGVTHVLAVSGQHVTIISGMFLAILGAFRIPLRIQAPIIIVFLFIFLIITGLPPSAMRATIMSSLTIFFLAMSKGSLQTSVMFGIAEAAMIVLFVNPKNIVQPSFTLSFAAVLSLGLISWPLDRVLKTLKGAPFLYIAMAALLLTILCTHPFYGTLENPGFHIPLLAVLAGGFLWCRQRFPADTHLTNFSYERLPMLIKLFVVAQGAILLGMMYPLSSFYFGRFALAGPYANLLAIPLTGIIVPMGLLAGLIGMIPGGGMFFALIMNATNNLLCQFFFYIAHYSTVWFPYPFIENLTVGRLAVYYALLGIFVAWEPLWAFAENMYYRYYKHAQDPAIRRNALGMAAALSLLALLLAAKAWERPEVLKPGILRVTFLSTGFGSSAVIQSPTGKTYLVDGGLNNRESRTDVGQRTIAPFLLKQGLKTIDAAILTCVGPEHTEGMGSILGGFRVKRFYDPVAIRNMGKFADEARADSERAYAMFLEDLNDPRLVESRRAPHVRRIYEGFATLAAEVRKKEIPRTHAREAVVVDMESVGNTPFRIHFLGPPDAGGDYRDRSAVLKVEYGSFSVLFTGDMVAAGTANLIRSAGRDVLASDILVVPNHGQNSAAMNSDLARAVQPSVVIFQAGKFERLYGKTDASKPIVDRAKEDYDLAMNFYQDIVGGDRVFDTQKSGEAGAVVIESDGKKYRIISMKGKGKL